LAKLAPVTQKFVLHWGEMGTRWGVNRTVAQIHALLYLSPRPLPADALVETLGVARSNVSTSLRELQGWGIVRVVHVMGDRRDHFDSMKDVWEMFQVILEQRKRREIDPTLDLLRECVEEAGAGGHLDAHTRSRLVEMKEFFETMTGCYQEFRSIPAGALKGFVGLKGKIRKLLGR